MKQLSVISHISFEGTLYQLYSPVLDRQITTITVKTISTKSCVNLKFDCAILYFQTDRIITKCSDLEYVIKTNDDISDDQPV